MDGANRISDDDIHIALLRQADIAFNARQYDRAFNRYRYLASESHHINHYYRAGICLLKLGMTRDAMVYFHAALGYGSHQYRAHYYLAVGYKQMDDICKAIDHIEEAVRINPAYKDAAALKLSLTEEFEKDDRYKVSPPDILPGDIVIDLQNSDDPLRDFEAALRDIEAQEAAENRRPTTDD